MKREKLKEEIEEILSKIKNIGVANFDRKNNQEHDKLWNNMINKAVELHRIVNPKHHDYMIKNRGVSPDEDTEKFYNHIHPVEDLLAYVDNPHANDDPIDKTIGEEFEFKVYSDRQGHFDKYKLKRTSNGWYVSFMAISGECDKGGRPFLYKNFKQDLIEYPKGLSNYLEWLWFRAKDEGLSKKEVQKGLNTLANWVNKCEKNKPTDGLWEGY